VGRDVRGKPRKPSQVEARFADRATSRTSRRVARKACYGSISVIRSFGDDTTQDIWNGIISRAARKAPKDLWAAIRRKLDQIDAVAKLDDLRIPPGNRPHSPHGDWAGYHAIRVNDQYRIVFRFLDADAHDVQCLDYH
jgi:toxin HigB-1